MSNTRLKYLVFLAAGLLLTGGAGFGLVAVKRTPPPEDAPSAVDSSGTSVTPSTTTGQTGKAVDSGNKTSTPAAKPAAGAATAKPSPKPAGKSSASKQPAASPPPAPPAAPPAAPPPAATKFSLRFFGTGSSDADRVKIPLTPNKSVDVGGNFTLEWWMKAAAGNAASGCTPGGVNWIFGNIMFDRDIFGGGDHGDYGISLYDNAIAFGVAVGGSESTICSSVAVSDGQWHHVAATRNGSSGQLCLYVDGTQRGCGNGPAGDMSYRDARSTAYPNSDPFLVIGAEKHDAGAQFPAYSGWIDEVRVSNTVRYSASFAKPTSAPVADGSTVALYHFDNGSGTLAADETGANAGTLKLGGASNGPHWSADTPF